MCTEKRRTASNLSVQVYGPVDQITGYLYQLPHEPVQWREGLVVLAHSTGQAPCK